MDVPLRHQLKIAKDTLRLSDEGARILGGMTKKEARALLLRHRKPNPDKNDKRRDRK